MNWQLDLQAAARRALSCLDLTSLNDGDTEADVIRLCERAQGPHGPVAAVCVWPRFAALARSRLPANISVAAVANFPEGRTQIDAAVADTLSIVQAGAQEVDVVLPYRAMLQGDEATVSQLLRAVRDACPGLTLKVILETGVLSDNALVLRASQLSLEAGADFLKTSTGKTPVNATPAAARTMVRAIAADPRAVNRVGFKPSGGIRTVGDAAIYLDITEEALGADALTPTRFRIGASSILNDIDAVLSGQAAPTAPSSGY